jgi:hypothetical protein
MNDLFLEINIKYIEIKLFLTFWLDDVLRSGLGLEVDIG